MKITRSPGYKQALKLLSERIDPILLDIGCCCPYYLTISLLYFLTMYLPVGTDIRKAVIDGWPVNNVLASDLRQGFWDLGHELFKSTPVTFPAAFIAGDVFDPAMLSLYPLGTTDLTNPPPLSSYTSLSPLQHRISAIHASSFFHLFDEEKQLELAKRLSTLLVLQKGSVIFGQHGSRPEKGYRRRRGASEENGMFCHSPESWEKLWTEEVFGPSQEVRVKVDALLIEWDSRMENEKVWVMIWSVEVL